MVLLWGLVIWVIVFWRLGYMSLLDPDEAHYAQLTREMIRARQWLVPTLGGVPFIDKPVLYHWLQMACESVFGETEFALRLPSALAAVALIWTVGWVGRSLSNRPAGNLAAILFATTPLTFALASIGVFDMVYTAFLFGAVGTLLVAATTQRRRLEPIGWSLLALAVMTKGPVAALMVVLFGGALALRSATRPLVTSLRWGRGLAFVALVSCPWFVFMAYTFGRRFFEDYLLAGNLWYFTRPRVFASRHSDAFFYVRTFLGGVFPSSLLVIAAGIDARLTRRVMAPAEQALWVWIALILGFFSVAGFKLDTYIFPAAPAACLAISLAWRPSTDQAPSPFGVVTTATLGVVAAGFVAAGAVLAATMFRIDLGLSAVAALLPMALITGGVYLGWKIRQADTGTIPGIIVGTLVCVYAVVIVEGFPVLERSRPTAPIGRWIARHAPSDAPVGVYGLDDWRGSIRFYSRRHLLILHNEEEVRDFSVRYPDSFALMLAKDYRGFRANGVALHAVGGRRAIVGRSGKFIRRQMWGRIVVTTTGAPAELQIAEAAVDVDLLDP